MNVLKSLAYPDEILALVKFKMFGCRALMPHNRKSQTRDQSSNMQRCYQLLNLTSRSFAAVIQALDDELRDPVCIFYLVLRALDTVEDDMSIPVNVKAQMLKVFHSNLYLPDWKFMDSTENDKMVLEEFPVISSEFRKLKTGYQSIIEDICQRMGNGMSEYLTKCPQSLEDWNQYCHYVAGLVGIGLSKLFEASGLESKEIGQDVRLANSMGLFLQKTNIIRDYLEDVLEERYFWPKEVWGKYCTDLPELRHAPKMDRMACLNELIDNALQHISDAIAYLSKLQNQSVFNFCAIPQVMAIATLERCFANDDVFKKSVKIRKGEAVKMMMESDNIEKVKAIFKAFLLQMKAKIPIDGLNSKLAASIERGLKVCHTKEVFKTTSLHAPAYVSCGLLLAGIIWQYWAGSTRMISVATGA